MSKNGVRAVPEGFHTITPHLVVRGAEKAIEFYKKALGATAVMCMPWPGGKIEADSVHCAHRAGLAPE